jgi:hypothetical protein
MIFCIIFFINLDKINNTFNNYENNTYFSRQHIFRWLLLCWLLVPWALQAQSARITWSSQVGCQEYRGEKGGTDDNGTTYSFINSSQCLRVCENSWVTYTVKARIFRTYSGLFREEQQLI